MRDRWFKVLGALVLIVFVAAGCVRVERTIVINDDGSGTVDSLTAIDSEGILELFAEFDLPEEDSGGTQEICDDFAADSGMDDPSVPAGATIQPFEEDGFCGARILFDLPASNDHSAALTNLFGDGSTRLFKEGENWIFESAVDLSDVDDSAAEAPGDFAEQLFSDAVFRVTVDLPGRAIDGQSNATSVGSDGLFEWDIDLANPPATLFAQTEPGSGGGDGGGGLGLILIIVAIVALVAAAAWWFLTQRNSGSTPPPAAAPGGPPAPGTPSAAPAQAPLSAPVKPDAPSAQQTISFNPAQAADALAAAREAADAANAPAEQAAAASPEPVWDAALNAWVINDPVQGKLVHDAATDSWRPA
ncbi:MAG: hypothetical protein AAF567_23740 [Actinomycetota bacterium]